MALSGDHLPSMFLCRLSDWDHKGVSEAEKGTRAVACGHWFCLTELTQSLHSSGDRVCDVPSSDPQQRFQLRLTGCGLALPESPCGVLGLNVRAQWAGLRLCVCVCPRVRGLLFPRALYPHQAGLSFETIVSPGTSLFSILCEPQASASNPLTGSQLDPRKDSAAENKI